MTSGSAGASVLTESSLANTIVVSGRFAVSLLISFAVTSEALDSATAGSVGTYAGDGETEVEGTVFWV